MKRFLAIAVIWLGCTVAWMILGGTLNLRTDSLSGSLNNEVNALWGPPGQQAPPLAVYQKTVLTEEVTVEQKPEGNSKKIVQHEAGSTSRSRSTRRTSRQNSSSNNSARVCSGFRPTRSTFTPTTRS